MKRREFIKTATAIPVLGRLPANLTTLNKTKTGGVLEKRTLGRTGEKLSLLGFGGIVVMDATPAEADERVARAIEYGVNYFDVAPSYGDAEVKLGPALQPYRKNVFLACKTQERSREGARKELEQSLKHLHTDHLDLYQLHAVTDLDEVETIFAAGGAMETFIRAKKEGQIRFIGFSAHSVEAAMSLLERFDFDTVLFPLNFRTWYAGNFGPQVVEKAREKQMGILALKAMADGPWPENAENKTPKCWYEPLQDPEQALMGLRFTLSLPVTAALPPGNENLYKMALDLGLHCTPLNESELAAIKEKAKNREPLFKYPQK
jgi:aryl-alcohol dehydrogenase-like predicted oxidoreductase